jgi:hypothetical protein
MNTQTPALNVYQRECVAALTRAGLSEVDARSYLEAEEWNTYDALASYRADRATSPASRALLAEALAAPAGPLPEGFLDEGE